MIRWWPYALAVVASFPGIYQIFLGNHDGYALTAGLAGLGILAAAFLLSWACEVAEQDIPQALAVSVLALVAVLPEYAVDATFAWKAASDPDQAAYAIANMTGGNRLLLGIGWPILILLSRIHLRRNEIVLSRDTGADIAVLLLATAYAMVPIARGSLNLWDTAVYLTLYVSYLVAASRGEEHEGEPVGPAALLAAQPARIRRAAVLGMLLFAASVIFVCAEPFAHALVESGKIMGVDEFVLVQWVAPLASESPEFVVAALMVWRGASDSGLRTLVSSNVNQWTLLVGTLSVVFSVALGQPGSLPMDGRQTTEMLLTAAQCLFGIAVISDLSLSVWQGVVLLVLFLISSIFTEAHFAVGVIYLVLFVGIMVVDRRSRQGIGRSFATYFRLLLNRKSSESDAAGGSGH